MSQDRIESETGRAYFSQVPHILFDYDLSHTEFRLWCYYNRVGNCWQSVETTAKGAGMSMGAVSNARKGLEAKGLIYVTGNDYGTSTIHVKDLWPENMAKYASPSKNESPKHKPSKFEGHPSNNETCPSKNETKNNPTIIIQEEETPTPASYTAFESQITPLEPSVADMVAALRKVTMLNNPVSLAEAARELLSPDIQATPEEIVSLFSGVGCYWLTEGMGKKDGSKPWPKNITGTIFLAREWAQTPAAAASSAASDAERYHAEFIVPLKDMNGHGREHLMTAPEIVIKAVRLAISKREVSAAMHITPELLAANMKQVAMQANGAAV